MQDQNMTSSMIVLSELEKERVWDGWLSCEMRGCYFAELVNYFQARQKWLTVLTLVFSSGAVLTIAIRLGPDWPKLVLSLLAAIVSAVSLVERNQDQALKCSDLHLEWNRLAQSYATLWDDMYSEDATMRLGELSERILELGKSSTAIPYQEKRMRRCQLYVESHHKNQ